MAKKSARQKIYKKLDDLTREAVRLRDNNICQYSGKKVSGSNSHTSHIIPKSKSLFLRWDLINLLVMSQYYHLHWWHENPVMAGEWFKEEYPARFQYLKENEHKQVRWRMADLRKIQAELEQEIEELKGKC